MALPADSHVHSEWSWDARAGDMEKTCARALDIGLPAIAFTEHLDHTVWVTDHGPWASHADPDGVLTPPAFDAAGYLGAIERCRDRFPALRILSGVEMGEPHWHAEACARVLGQGKFDRVLGSLHSLPFRGGVADPFDIMPHRDPAGVVREYLAGVIELVTTSDLFQVLAHIDYPVRSWPGRFDPRPFEEEFRAALRATARAGRALEINTRLPLHELILTWWRQEGGDAITFGSDAHVPEALGNGFTDAARMAEAHGFRPGRFPYELWRR